MKRRVPGSLSRKEFLLSFASLVAYSAPAVLVLQPLGCAGSGTPAGLDGGNCSTSGTSVSCSSDSTSCSISGTSISC